MKKICREIVLFGALLLAGSFQLIAAPGTLQFSSRYIGSPAAQASLIVADHAGSLFVISNGAPVNGWFSTPFTIQVTRTDLSGNVLGTFSFGGSGGSTAKAAVIDSAGNLVIAGSTSSADFPLVSPLQSTGGGFIAKMDPQLHGIVYSTRFAGLGINALTADINGNIYFAGTASSGVPVTPGAFQTQGSTAIGAASTYVAEISASGSKLVFATYYSGARGTMIAGFVPLYPPVTIPEAITVDGAGNIVVAGNTSDTLPVTSGAYSMVASSNTLQSEGFAAKFQPGGSGLVWATYLPHVTVNAAAQDGAANLLLAGVAEAGFATTANAIQSAFPQTTLSPIYAAGRSAGFVLKLASGGDRLIDATYFGGNTITSPNSLVAPGVGGLALNDSGDVWITGSSSPLGLPSNAAPALGQNYVAELSPDLGEVLALNSVPDGSAGTGVAATTGGTAATIGTGNLMLLASMGSASSFLGLASSPAFQTSGVIAPAELVTLYGIGIGPAAGQGVQVGSDGIIGTKLGGVEVLFNGISAALLYVSPNQINAIVPASLKGLGQTNVTITGPGSTLSVPGVTVQDYVPTMFSNISGFAAPVVNADGTINGPTNPAAGGSVVAVWLTGAGSATGSDNRTNIAAPVYTSAPISVLTYQPGAIPLALDVLYAGDAPEQPNGVSQINFRLPSTNTGLNTSYESFNVQVGPVTSGTFYIYVK